MGDRETLEELRRLEELEARAKMTHRAPTPPQPMPQLKELAPYYLGPLGSARAMQEGMHALDTAAYNAGGATTDFASKFLPPGGAAAAGTGVNLLTQSLPMSVGGGVGKAIQVPLEAGARRFMQFALKPDRAAMESGHGQRAIITALEQGRNPTLGAVDKAWGEVGDLNRKVDRILAHSNEAVLPGEAGTELASKYNRFAGRPDSAASKEEALRQYKALKNHEYVDATGQIPVAKAHEMKKRAYEQIGDAPYERMTNPDATAVRMAVAKGLRDSVVKKVPETGPVLTKEGELINWLDVAEPRALMQGNTSVVGLSPLTPNPQSMFAYLLGKMPLANSLVARGLYQTGKGAPLAGAAAGAATPEENRKALIEALKTKLGE